MKQRWIAFAAAMLVATAAPSRADEPIGQPDGVLRAVLPNGLRVVIVPDKLAPVVTTELSYLAGSNDAPEGFPGTAHALEHMMFRGSEGLDRDQLAELGARLGGVYNASTTETVTQYTYTVAADDLSVALHSEASRMRGLSLNQADWQQERGAIEQEVSRDLSSPFYTYISQAQALLFEGTPYAHDALGTRPSFDKTDAALLRQFYERWYSPTNAILVIAGDVHPDAALAEVRTAFGDIPGRTVPPHTPIVMSPVEPKTLAFPTDFPVGLVTLAYRMPGLRAADFAAADILGDVLSSRRGALYGLVPAGRALLAQFTYRAKPDVGMGLAVAAFPKGADPAPLLDDMRNVFADAAQNGVPPDLVDAAKQQEIAQLAFATDSISGLATSWSNALAFAGAQSPDDVARAYAAVTPADVNRLARELLQPDHAITAILTPRAAGKPAPSGGFGGAESFDSVPDHPVALPPWASAALASLSVPDPGATPDVSVLPNGLQLVVQPETVSHTISVYGRVREVTEMEERPGKEGVAALTSALFGYGTQSHDRLALRKALDDIAATESAGPGFSLKVLTSEFEPGMRLLAENELRPAFPEAAFAVLKAQAAQSLSGLLQSPGYLYDRAVLQTIVPSGDPALREASPATVAALQRSDVLAYYAAAYRPDLTTIIVAGDVTPEQARRVVNETFGGWQAEGPTPAIDLPPAPPSGPSQARVTDESSLQDSVSLSETMDVSVTSPDRYTLMLGNTILGNGFSSRLYSDLRVKTGYVYTVSSAFNWSRTRADYSVNFGADTVNVEKARQLIVRDIRDMQSKPVNEAELLRAKAQMLRRLPMQRASVPAIAGGYLRLAELGLPLDLQQTAGEHYLAITAADIERAFATALRPDTLSEIVKGPPF